MDCARKTIAVDGIGALWKGFGPAMARAFPANAATFVSLILNFVHRSFVVYFLNTAIAFARHFEFITCFYRYSLLNIDFSARC